MLIKRPDGVPINLLGDPHLGRRFVHGVPLARLGEREASLLEDFKASLRNGLADIHLCMGDLFDGPFVSYTLLLEVAKAYRAAAKHRLLWVIKGNHDYTRDLEKRSAFDVLASLVPEVTWISEPRKIGGIGLFPYSPTRTAEELVREADWLKPGMLVFGHWDTDGAGPNLIPTKALAEKGVTKAYTGHVHLPAQFVRDGVDVVVVGSMQPLAHGEGPLYVTKTLAEVKAAPDSFKDKCLRVLLARGEVFDIEVDCLQLTFKRAEDDTASPEVKLDSFDINELFTTAFDDAGVPEELREQLRERFNARS